MFYSKKGLSPLITTILLIIVTFALIGIVLTWGKNFSTGSLNKVSNVYNKSDLDGYIYITKTLGNKIILENRNPSGTLTISKYKINSNDTNKFWLNSYHNLETPLTLKPYESGVLNVICIPSKKFSISVYNDITKTYLSLNGVESVGSGVVSDTCDTYNVQPWMFSGGTGDYNIEEISIAQGELVTNGGFDTDDLSFWNYVIRCNKSYNSIYKYMTLTGTTDGDNVVFGRIGALTINKRYRIKFDIKSSNHNSLPALQLNAFSGKVYIQQKILSDNWQTFIAEGTSITGNLGLYAANSHGVNGAIYDIDNVSVVEIPPLEDLTTGTKYLENVTAGTTAIQSKQAYGEWEFDMYKDVEGNEHKISFVSNGDSYNNNGYMSYIGNDEVIYFFRINKGASSTLLFKTAPSYINNNTWYKIKVVRLQSEGVFKDIPTLQTSDLMTSVGNPYTNFVSKGRYGFRAVSDGSAPHYAGTADEISIINGGKYLVEFNLKLNSGTLPIVRFREILESTTISNAPIIVNGKNSHILTATKTTTGVLSFQNNSTATDYTISGLTIRRIYPKDTFAVFIKGGDFGNDEWTLVDTTGGSGTNPVTDSTYTTSNYLVADLDAGDRLANLKISN